MSIEAAVTLAAPIIERPIAYVYDASARHLHYLTQFIDNFECLRDKMNELVALKEDVKRRIEVEENNQQMERTHMVVQWLESVEASQKVVDPILQKCSAELEFKLARKWWARYKLGKKVCKKLITVADLISQGKFDVVADKSPPAQVEVQPESRTVGMKAKFEEVWSWIGDDQTKIIGIYGMGGVGKTTLLKKINNKFKEVCRFDLVIWVVVSSKFSVQNVQKQIMERLGLTSSDDQNIKARCICNALSKKKFLVLLDDIWEGLDLEAVGIPSPYTSDNISKVVFTTRSEKVCGSMEANKKFKVPVLEWEHAWELFQQKVGEDTLNYHPEIPKLAKAVAEECGGLPLALITIGRAMSTKKTPLEWNHDLEKLKQYASQFEDMEAKVFSILKFSYDSLDDTARDCFLYCSLFPEDYYINTDEIILYWIGEGFFDELEEFDMAWGQGYAVIRTLKSACLLEMGSKGELYVKLHDVVRDLALWIANECGNKYLVQAGVGLSQAPKIEDWEGKERICLMRNGIRELTGAPNCPRLVTLMLQRNFYRSKFLSVIPDDFFQYMSNLKVLDLEQAHIKYLPKSIGCLLELRYLNLRDTHIKTLPDELRNLVKLTHLNLLFTSKMTNIPNGILSCLSRLQVLLLGPLCWDDQIEAEFEAHQHLGMLGLVIRKLPAPQVLVFSQRSLSCLKDLLFHRCPELTELALMSTHLGKTKKLRRLYIRNCRYLKKLTINSLEADKDDMGPLLTLEELMFEHLSMSSIIWEETATHLHFKHVTEVCIRLCDKLKDISWLVLVPFLKNLRVDGCKELEEIILGRFAAVTIEDQNALSRLVKMEFQDLPKLKSIVKAPFSFPSLQSIKVARCPLLKKLPFSSNTSRLQKFEGGAKWWNELEWEDQTIKTSLQPSFIPIH